MNASAWLKKAEYQLQQANIATARLDSILLIEHVLKRDRAWILANTDAKIMTAELAELNKLLKRRTSHEPIAYLLGKTEFYGREFVVSAAVLEPRPESETMIDCLVGLHLDWSTVSLADVGSGSGALGITAKLELPNMAVELLEIDPGALKVTEMNVDKFTVHIPTIKSDLLSSSNKNYDILLCNLPYVPDDFQINMAATHEPKLAIFGGDDGLDLYNKLFSQLDHRLKKPLYILTESLPIQHEPLSRIAAKSGYSLTKTNDFIQVYKYKN